MTNKDLPDNIDSIFESDDPFSQVLSDLQTKGWSIQDDFFSDAFIKLLIQEAEGLNANAMSQAGVGRHQEHQVKLNARGDTIQWIDGDTPVRNAFLNAMEELRIAINRRLFLGLFDYEAHFARYGKGAFYEKHIDSFQAGGSSSSTNRLLSTVLYLNQEWSQDDGGEFVIYDEHNTDLEIGRFLPRKGRFAVFLSECFYHEVKPANRSRYSIAGWFRTNNTTGQKLDPNQ
ncbi:2OG-Fe(II) oxygenase [Marinomonas sp. C2222]|uniref:2OG-Fe(II) oxygenase n=1 Tax=Marinomonas sargassi TaxID=2984494 RepID=A0ABT2YRX2_9GAMM|nr:2OG-Fe(II) oxygenase [Marinomonas sargassi]MCV2402647.1 2OG-Fe(II) oxygenase [Marinomonas sargassi]